MGKKSKPVRVSQDKKWEVEDGARTLVRAQEIRNDKPLLKQVKVELKKQAKATTQAAKVIRG